jgi:hypothetical protein
MSIGRGIMAALSGGLTGLAEAAVREDEKRDELSKITLSQAMKNIEQAKELARNRQEELREEEQVVDTLMQYEVDGQPVSRGQAISAYRQYGKNAASMLLQGQLSFEGTGTVTAGTPTQRGEFTMPTGSADIESRGLFASGRSEALQQRTINGLKAAGYSPAGVDIPSMPQVEGVTVRAGKGLADRSTTTLYTNTPGLETVERVQAVMPDGSTTTTYRNLLGNDVTEQFKTANENQGFKVATNSDDLYSGIKPDGIAFKIGDDGVPQALPFVVGYDKNGAAYRKSDETGDFDIKIVDPSIVTLNSYQLDALGGADGVTDVFDTLGKTGRTAYNNFNDQAESFGRSVNVVRNQMDLLNEHGDALVADIGSVAEFIEYARVNLGVGIKVVADAGQEFLELSPGDLAILEQKQQDLQDDLSRETDPRKKLAVARRLYQANQILFAYSSARSVTNDTRISNQDFDLFFKTVSGSSAASQIAIYQNRLLDAKVAVNERYTTLKSTAQARGEGAEKILESIPSERTPTGMDQTIIDVFKTSTPAETTEEVKKKADTVSKEASQYVVQKRLVDPDTGEPDPNGIEAIVVERGGQIQRYPDGSPIVFDPKEYTQDSVSGHILNGLIRDNKIVAPKE